jgi:hypothetical protein
MEEIPLPHETLFPVCATRREDGCPARGPSGGDSLREFLKIFERHLPGEA